MDVEGVRAAKPIYEAAGATFAAWVDPQNQLGEALGFKVIPNGFFIDEAGIVRGKQIGGFDVSSPRSMRAVEEFLATPPAAAVATPPESDEARLRRLAEQARAEPRNGQHRLQYGGALVRAGQHREALTEIEEATRLLPDSGAAHFNLGTALLALERREEALQAFEKALKLDRENYVVRKQIWLIRYPERFHPTIDWNWQRDQLRKEREQESKDGRSRPGESQVS
jgi:tetratricopeptide (TPR) repeat protein